MKRVYFFSNNLATAKVYLRRRKSIYRYIFHWYEDLRGCKSIPMTSENKLQVYFSLVWGSSRLQKYTCGERNRPIGILFIDMGVLEPQKYTCGEGNRYIGILFNDMGVFATGKVYLYL